MLQMVSEHLVQTPGLDGPNQSELVKFTVANFVYVTDLGGKQRI
jgi:hypothetical protein